MTSVEIRSKLVEALQLDLVGPGNGHAFAHELLPESPTRWYLTGFLVPSDAPLEQRIDETATEQIDSGGSDSGGDDAVEIDRGPARRSILPSSMGLSVFVQPELESLEVTVSWGDYVYEGGEEEEDSARSEESDETSDEQLPLPDEGESDVPRHVPGEDSSGAAAHLKPGWRRKPREETLSVLLEAREKPLEVTVPNGSGLSIVATVRPVSATAIGADRLPMGTRSVALFLVNRRKPDLKRKYRAFAFQTSLQLRADKPFVPRPDLRTNFGSEVGGQWDELVADLQYRDIFEYAVGHGVSVTADVDTSGKCSAVRTTWIPCGEVEWVVPAEIPDVELGMEALGVLADADQAAVKLKPLSDHYRSWINDQRSNLQGLDAQRTDTAKSLLIQAEHAAKRIDAGISMLSEPDVLEAFRLANRTMAMAARRREAIQRSTEPSEVGAPRWRPFQLAFILMTLRSIAEPTHVDREVVDLLFFPTGGGKTEAYLGLAAFSMVLRRLRNPGITSAGLSVLMRYTLRLLTLDQLARASALVCALELEREKDKLRLGAWPFEIGLWVGSAATPNRMGGRNYSGPGRQYTAYVKTTRYQQDNRQPAPIPLENCPWCGTKFTSQSFRLVPNNDRPVDLRISCVNYKCEFSGDRALPILGVDEPLYRRLPAFLIATIDKFAALPWTGETGALFGLVERFDRNGFYGPCAPGMGQRLEGGYLPPPDLIIQDELHLISGPLGTIAGVYETAIDALASRIVDGKTVRPKILASTATVRRADSQIKALFERNQVTVFPPPGPDRRDSFFAKTRNTTEVPARLYVGVAAQGRSLKVVLLRSALALLAAGETAYLQAGGKQNSTNPADPYMTLLGYFNSLRELGGSRRIVEDEVTARLSQYSLRRRIEPDDRQFTSRKINYDVLELTSREPTNKVATAKARLARPFYEEDRVDVALATNMISVGLDIIRLGLMVVLGQPKTSSEYIQATSRVGRDSNRPGLVITLLNVHKPRDRSHYERFQNFHSSFYRTVEATSVTPFSPRALDRALPAALVGLCRQGLPEMTPSSGATEILAKRNSLDNFAQRFSDRAGNSSRSQAPGEEQRLRDKVLARSNRLLDDWLKIADQFRLTGGSLQYQKYEPGNAQRLLYDFLDPELLVIQPVRTHFRANRSMRDVEPSVELVVENLNDWE
jgi:hypothetical protein